MNSLLFHAFFVLLCMVSLSSTFAQADTGAIRPASTYEMLVLRALQIVKEGGSESIHIASFDNNKITPGFWSRIKLKQETLPWSWSPNNAKIQLDYPAPFLPSRTRIFWVDQGNSMEIHFTNGLYSWPDSSIKKASERLEGFSGLRFLDPDSEYSNDGDSWFVILGDESIRAKAAGSSYGAFSQIYNLPKEGLGSSSPRNWLSEVYIESTPSLESPQLINGWIENADIVGAVKILLSRGSADIIEDVEASFFVRRKLEVIDLIPLIGSFTFGEDGAKNQGDIHPEVHDVDGAIINDSSDNWIFRPLLNPPKISDTLMRIDNPKGFGLVQRDRNPQHYMDATKPETRTSVWVEPIAPFGQGFIHLTELHDDGESSNNVSISWRPIKNFSPGESINLHYRVHWTNRDQSSKLAHYLSTYFGRINQLGSKATEDAYRFRVEFDGSEYLPSSLGDIEIMAKATKGKFFSKRLIVKEKTGSFFVEADFNPEGNEPSELEISITAYGKPISEIWKYRVDHSK